MADNTSNTSDFIQCSVFDTGAYVTVAIISSCSAFVSALCCVLVISLIFMLKKHYFFIQRLVLYLSIVALIHSSSIVLRLYRIGYRQQSDVLKMVCIAAAFIDQTSMWSLFLAFGAITLTLLMAVTFHKSTARLEAVYLVVIFLFPLTFNWVPFLYDTYGQAGAWCWIRTINYNDNCSEHKFGTYLQFGIWYVPGFVFLGILLLVYLFILLSVLRQKYKNHKSGKEQIHKTLRKEVWPLLFYPIGVFILNIFPLVNRIQGSLTTDDPVYALWVLHAIFSPLQGGYIALVFILDRETLRRLTCRNFVAFIKSSDGVSEYPAVTEEVSDSADQSGVHSIKKKELNKGENEAGP